METGTQTLRDQPNWRRAARMRAVPSPSIEDASMITVFDYGKVLAALQQIAPEAHIAGGAVRDTILQKPIHDVDVFMKDEHVEEAAALLRSSCSYVKVGEWKRYLGFSDPAMTRVAKFEKADETTPICIIGLEPGFVTPKDNMARFDFGICMAAFDGKNEIRTAKFNQDAEGQTFTLHRADNQAQFTYSISRFETITAARYQGWKLVVPNAFERLAKDHAWRRSFYVDYVTGAIMPKGIDGKNVLRPKEREAAHQ
jgi:Poly A polymerase head domain